MKKLLTAVTAGLISLAFNTNAQTPALSAPPAPPAASSVTAAVTPSTPLASQFAQQAGAIAGTVQACGQSIGDYNNRVIEAVNALTPNAPADRVQAMTDYQKALTNAQADQMQKHAISCPQAMQAFNSLPLMRSDYKTTVLPQLAQMANSPAPANNSPAAAGNK